MVLATRTLLVLPEGLVVARPGTEQLRPVEAERAGRWIAGSTRHHGTLVSAPDLHAALARALTSLRRPDGGLPVSLEGTSEVEPTALAALALDDPWRSGGPAARQRRDGGFDELEGRRDGPTTGGPRGARARRPSGCAPLARLCDRTARVAALQRGRSRAAHGLGLDGRRPVARRADCPRPSRSERADAERCGDPARGPRAAYRAAVRRRRLELRQRLGLRRRPARVRADDRDGADRASAGHPGVERAFAFLQGNWRLEPGGLTVAQALVAYRLHGRRDEAPALLAELRKASRRPSFLSRPLAVAWATLATGPDALLEPLRTRA